MDHSTSDPAGAGGATFAPLASEQVEAMVAAWRRGERPKAEEFLAGLGDEAAIRLIFEEICLRREAGQPVGSDEIAARFPRWQAELQALLDCHRLMELVPVPSPFPAPGEELAGFRLRAELGRGVSGRVYLATQPALADRPVVLKVTPAGREEHLRLARLQHMNIVPLYSEQVLTDRHLQLLCMPALGGASLAHVLDALESRLPARRTGALLLEALDRLQAGLPVDPQARGPYRRFLARATYVEAICWIVAGLADGLQYAHDRDLLHLDVKPSNVLLAGDGQPMLLDFHLARGPILPGEPTPARLGGTPGYMPPEQIEAIQAVRDGRPIRGAVDGRADIFALGLLLDEALGGAASPFGPRPPLRRRNPRVSAGLAAIVRRCLRSDPRGRYPDAAALAADLRRHLDNLPLRGVPDRSPTERWRKWRRRRPDALSRDLVLLALAVAAIAVGALLRDAYGQRVRAIDSALAEGRAARGRHQYPEAVARLERGRALAAALPGGGRYREELGEELALARRDGEAAELHRLADLVRFRYGIDPPPPAEARSFVDRGRAIWRARAALTRAPAGRGEPEVERAIRADLLDFALVWADLRVRSAPPGEAAAARAEALRVLDEAEAQLGPSPALDRDRRKLAVAPEAAAPATDPAPGARTAWEHYDLGRSYLRSGEVAAAAEQFRLGIDLRPQDFWLNFYQALCAYTLGRHADAANAFRVCIALSPQTAECYYNRALALGAMGKSDAAIADYTRARDLAPALTEALLNRGILHYQSRRLSEATADFRRALAEATDPALLGTIRFNLSLVDLAREDRKAALANLEAAIRAGHAEARKLHRSLGP